MEALERELRDALALEPSPDFARGVRARIDQGPVSRVPAMFRWEIALAAAAVVAIAIGLGWRATRDLDSAPPGLVTHAGSDVQLDAPRAQIAPPPSPVRRTPPRPVRAANATETAQIVEPEVIVPPDRAEGLARFLELARTQAMGEEMLPPMAAATPGMALDIAPLVVAPIVVPEIDRSGGAAPDGADRE